MTIRNMPKTLAKTLAYILYHSSGEYGLFWNPDGTMPWKELYWALQEDPSLRFVRESKLREIAYLGIELPASLEGNILRLRPDVSIPVYPAAEQVPERLYHGCSRRHYPVARRHGLAASSRPFVALASDKELALRIGRRLDPQPVLIEVSAKKASMDGILFRIAGPELYLVEFLPVESLICPPLRVEDAPESSSSKKRTERPASKPDTIITPGSFIMHPDHLRDSSHAKGAVAKGKEKGKKGEDWKRQSRKERHKRSI
jgi:putative RNA 2'-phosphotransferase